MPRPRRRQPDPARFPPCARCGQCYPGGADSWPEGRVCKYCYLQARLRTGTCADCGALTSLPGLNATGQPACTRCSGIPARFRCGCGRDVTAGERGRCWWCVLAGLVTGLLTGPGGQVAAQLRPLADGLVSMRRPQSGVVWLRRSAITREALRDLARDRIPCSHPTLDALGADRAVEYLRCLLVRYGVLPGRDRRLADFQRWAAAKVDGIGNGEHRRLLERFLRWRLLRHLRSCSSTAAPLGHRPYQRAKQRLTMAIAFLAWLDGRGRQLGECTQHDLDQWFATGPTTRRHVITFLSWARQQRIIHHVAIPVISTDGAEVWPPGPDARLTAIRRLLLDETLTPGDRLAGCVVTLYGQQACATRRSAAPTGPPTPLTAGFPLRMMRRRNRCIQAGVRPRPRRQRRMQIGGLTGAEPPPEPGGVSTPGIGRAASSSRPGRGRHAGHIGFHVIGGRRCRFVLALAQLWRQAWPCSRPPRAGPVPGRRPLLLIRHRCGR